MPDEFQISAIGPDITTLDGPNGEKIQAMRSENIGFGLASSNGKMVGTLTLVVNQIGIYVPMSLDDIDKFRAGLDVIEQTLKDFTE